VEKSRKLWALGALLCVLLGLTVFLIMESRYFAVQVGELIQLKADYANYVIACKKVIAERAEVDSETKESKKKKQIADNESSEGTDEFVTVNRDFNYLRRSALAYARLYKRELAISELYRAGREQLSVQNSSHRRQRIRRKERRHVLGLHNRHMDDLAHVAGFIWPLKRGSYRLSSKFGPRRRANGTWGVHKGLDMAAPLGVSVQAVQHGVVLEARNSPRGFGNVVVIAHSNKLKTRYAHLSKITVHVGDTVEQGQRIGRVGNTGHTTGKNGYHLHFEVIVYGKQTDPLYFLR